MQENFTNLLWSDFGYRKCVRGKVCLFKSCYVPIILYEGEICTWTNADISRLAAEMTFLRNVVGRIERERIRSEKIRKKLRQMPWKEN